MKFALTDTISGILGVPVRETRKNALVRCPFHDDRVASLSIDLERGFWICFACGERGGIHSLAARLGANLNDTELVLKAYEGTKNFVYEEPKDFSKLAEKLRDRLAAKPVYIDKFLTDREIDPRVIEEFGLGLSADGRIAFPYYDDGQVIGVKYRDAAGHKSSETGSRRGIYNVDHVRMRPVVILCEGESDTLAVWSNLTRLYDPDKVRLVGVGGVPGVAAANSTWDLWALDLHFASDVFVAYDADEAGDLGAKLPMAALDDVKTRVHRIRPTKGKDMTDHLLNGGTLHEYGVLAGHIGFPVAVASAS